ncbi:MFS transporter fsa7 [Fulvia fulva]|uniref:MFS transporter fsa7 n=1 Tax=Passalora fulva TaxID=5499 RepID=A0A9Q8LEK6_PASFU|nr:MFS transporter fsa7 [Fulvia fulva]KAK4616582.1 MFS transporter fsa7 [Fulvia fulva]UJO16055.1 MFS transporter fsa7 [Fulvia fulva]
MDDHFYSHRWSDLERAHNDPMEGPSNHRKAEPQSRWSTSSSSQNEKDPAIKHKDDDPMEGPSNYRELEDRFHSAAARPKSQHDSINQLHVDNSTMAALQGDRVSFQPGLNTRTTSPKSPSPTRGRHKARKSFAARASQHIFQMRLSKPSTWVPKGNERTPSEEYEPGTLISNDPNDPHNWSEFQKKLTYLTICLFCFLANVNASAFTVATVALIRTFRISPTQATALTALNVLTFGLGNLIWVPVMRILGKKPVYLMAIVVLIVTNVWSCVAGSYGSLLAARMCSGLGAAAADATVPSVVNDLWHGRRKAEKLMWFSGALASGIFLGPLINAWVVERHGWRWTPGWLAGAFGVMFVLAFLFIRETTYRLSTGMWSEEEKPRKKGFVGWMSLTIGREREKNAGEVVVQTLRDIVGMTVYVQVLWASCLIGVIVGWTIIIQITAGQVFTRPAAQGGAYHWRLGLVGVFHIAGWLGAITAGRVGGRFADALATRAQMRQRLPQRPPQCRMQTLAFWAPVCPIGLIIYGVCVAKTTLWVGPAFGYAIHSFGFAAIANIGITYVVDCFGELASEGLVSLFIIRNIIGVVCSFYCNPWIARDGMPAAFGTMAALEWILLACAVPMFFFHDRLLTWTKTYGPAVRLPAPTHPHTDQTEMQTIHPPAESV